VARFSVFRSRFELCIAKIDHVDETRFVYRGYLFGHYHSRGDTMFVEADSKEQALRHYALGLGFEPDDYVSKPTTFDLAFNRTTATTLGDWLLP
jgi:hypothetical protein